MWKVLIILLEYILLPLIERHFPLFYILLDSSKWNSTNCIVKSYHVTSEILQMCVDKIAISNFIHGLEKSVSMTRKEDMLKKKSWWWAAVSVLKTPSVGPHFISVPFSSQIFNRFILVIIHLIISVGRLQFWYL